MPTPFIDYPRLVLDFEVKLYTQKQDFVTNPDKFRGFQLGSKVTNPGLFAGTIRHLSTYRNIFSIVLVLLRMTLNFCF